MSKCILERVPTEGKCRMFFCESCGWNTRVEEQRKKQLRTVGMTDKPDGTRTLKVRVRRKIKKGNTTIIIGSDDTPAADEQQGRTAT